MNKAKKEALTQQYMTNVPAMTEYQRTWIRKETAHHITITRDSDGNHVCHCDRCNTTFTMNKTKHKDILKCPSCGHKLEVLHMWRKFRETLDWIAIPRVIDDHTFMLRYVYVYRHEDKVDIKECARGVFNLNTDSFHTFELRDDGKWIYSRRSYFTEYNMYNFRTWCCLQADLYKPSMIRELKKLNGMKYFVEFLPNFTKSTLYAHTMIGVLSDRCGLYEKLCKVGLTKLAQDDFYFWGTYSRNMCIKYRSTQTSLLDILGINRNQLKLLKNNQSINALAIIKMMPKIDQELLNYIVRAEIPFFEIRNIKNEFNIRKLSKYIATHSCTFYEWKHYVDLLKKLNYTLDDGYLYPDNFRREDNRVTAEYTEKERIARAKANAERRKQIEAEEAKRNDLIFKISEGLRNNPNIREFFSGSDGLQIMVPDNANDLVQEGERLHNCLRTYPDRYANGKTLIFFVRRIEDPTAPYVAMEYCNGIVAQLRCAYNGAVKDEKVINFSKRLAEALAKNNILAA